ncbi:MAG TPA: hypothetical protein VG916_02355 [Gemmatimonadaceae bacterium]|nr:hypothetical protein [Gemmatimonadaceae bacterium]
MTEVHAAERRIVERVASALLAAGAVIGTLALGAWVLDTFSLMPSWTVDALTRMPAWLLRLAVYKVTLAAGGGLVIAGAVLRRQMREAARRDPPTEAAPAALGDGVPPFTASPRTGAAQERRDPYIR